MNNYKVAFFIIYSTFPPVQKLNELIDEEHEEIG